ncbi:MAG: glycerophosphodiester phosphodiesterase [Candidatus Marinimicrobia bacterium]|nr:glycerophosphodiester phosphodiesterase [Candidatus Neomarinimicrobiota bacterium]
MLIWIETLLLLFLAGGLYTFKYNWKPKTPHFLLTEKLTVIGHRGAPVLAKENTLDSFKSAFDAGLIGIELDVQLSSDNKLVVFHDYFINHPEIPANKVNNIPYNTMINIRDNNIPLLSDVIQIIPEGSFINIEIKSNQIINTGIEKKVLTEIKTRGIENACIVSSFNPFVLRRIKKLAPHITTAFLWTAENTESIVNSPLWVWYCRPDGFHADIRHIDEKLIDWIRGKKLFALAYTVNSQKHLTRARDLLLDGIFTDDPYLNKE